MFPYYIAIFTMNVQGITGRVMQEARDPKNAKDAKEKHEIQQIIKDVENDLLSYTKIMHVKAYSITAIKRRLARSPDNPMAKPFELLEEKIALLARIFKVKCNMVDLKPFFTIIKFRYLNPPKQTLIDEWIKRFTSQDNEKQVP